MSRQLLLLLLCGVLLAGLGADAVAVGPPERGERASEKIPNRYIVVFRDSVENVRAATRRRERAHGFKARLRYSRAVKGFAARLSARQAGELRRDAQVVSVTADRRVQALDALSPGDAAPTGVRRIEAASTSQVHGASSVNVAVIDTGIDLAHPDLNAVSGTDCVQPGTSAQDDEGHGTHVAGTIAARNDGAGVVGVAPATRLHAVKVLDGSGSGTWSQIICGIDWVTATRTDADPANDIAVANMSLGGGGTPVEACSATMTDPLHKAICGSTQAGVVYTVAAGNDAWDYDYQPIPDVPAAYPEVLTVTAASDTDGLPGALGSACGKGRWGESDDRHATFSNYALLSASFAHTLAAPGACILSDRLGGGTTTYSGTSMAAPHVAGAVALCIAEAGTSGPCAGLAANRPQDFIARVTKTDAAYGFYGDPNQQLSGGRFFGYLAWVGLSTSSPDPDTTPPAAPTGLTATAGDSLVSLDWANNAETDLAGYDVYRATVSGGPYTKLNATPLADSAYTDTGLSNGTTYYYVVRAVDTSANPSAASSEASATPAAASDPDPGGAISLSASGFKVKGVHHADLTWSGATTSNVDLYRDGTRVATTANDGAHVDNIGKKGGGSYVYKLCEAGSTSACSAEVTVTF